jgi:hypothetical protein
LCVENGHIHVVVGDTKIIDTFVNSKTVTVYKSLSDFVKSEIIQNELNELDVVNKKEEIRLAIENYENECGEISIMLSKDIGEAIMWKTINDSSIPDDNNEATIDGYDEAEDIEFNFTELTYYGNGQFGIPFMLKINVSATYYIFKSDYYCMEDAPSVTDHNDHYFEAEDEFEVIVTGTVSISIDRDNMKLDKFSECINQDLIAIDEIESIELCE